MFVVRLHNHDWRSIHNAGCHGWFVQRASPSLTRCATSSNALPKCRMWRYAPRVPRVGARAIASIGGRQLQGGMISPASAIATGGVGICQVVNATQRRAPSSIHTTRVAVPDKVHHLPCLARWRVALYASCVQRTGTLLRAFIWSGIMPHTTIECPISHRLAALLGCYLLKKVKKNSPKI